MKGRWWCLVCLSRPPPCNMDRLWIFGIFFPYPLCRDWLMYNFMPLVFPLNIALVWSEVLAVLWDFYLIFFLLVSIAFIIWKCCSCMIYPQQQKHLEYFISVAWRICLRLLEISPKLILGGKISKGHLLKIIFTKAGLIQMVNFLQQKIGTLMFLDCVLSSKDNINHVCEVHTCISLSSAQFTCRPLPLFWRLVPFLRKVNRRSTAES